MSIESHMKSFNEELKTMTTDMMSSYSNLMDIEEIDIATSPKTEVWSSGKIRLFHMESDNKVKCKVPLLIAYALINRQDMMDLQPDRSMVRNLQKLGIDIYVIDWGYAGQAERHITMDDYVNLFLDEMVDVVRERHDLDKINLMGVCQGGTLSAIYASQHPDKVQNLITTVAPIDFDTEDGLLFKWSRDMDVDNIVDANGGVVPGEFLNFGFDMLKPMAKVRKYNGITNILKDKEKMMNFFRMENWVADSPSQAGECYRQFIKDLYQQNKLVKGELMIGGKKVDLKNITMPLLNIYASEDHLVPPSATKPLNKLVGSKDKHLYEVPGGHIGVFVGSRAQKELSPKIADFLIDRQK